MRIRLLRGVERVTQSLQMAEEAALDQLGVRLRQAREAAGITQDDLARMSGVRGPTIYRYEKGRISAPRADIALALSESLGITIRWLLTGELDEPAVERSPGLVAFLASPQSDGLTDHERRTLESIRFYGMEAGPEMYAGVLSMMRVYGAR